jgi:hypothetical protein
MWLRSGGSICWRFNNPGNLRPSVNIKTAIGIGESKSGEFLIFPDYETGRAEETALLRRKYNNKSIASAMYIYAPPVQKQNRGVYRLYLQRYRYVSRSVN